MARRYLRKSYRFQCAPRSNLGAGWGQLQRHPCPTAHGAQCLSRASIMGAVGRDQPDWCAFRHERSLRACHSVMNDQCVHRSAFVMNSNDGLHGAMLDQLRLMVAVRREASERLAVISRPMAGLRCASRQGWAYVCVLRDQWRACDMRTGWRACRMRQQGVMGGTVANQCCVVCKDIAPHAPLGKGDVVTDPTRRLSSIVAHIGIDTTCADNGVPKRRFPARLKVVPGQAERPVRVGF